jgi:hypothetical protein
VGIRDELDSVKAMSSRHWEARSPVSSASSRFAPFNASSCGGAARRDLPRVGIERVSVLPHEQDSTLVERDNADRADRVADFRFSGSPPMAYHEQPRA